MIQLITFDSWMMHGWIAMDRIIDVCMGEGLQGIGQSFFFSFFFSSFFFFFVNEYTIAEDY